MVGDCGCTFGGGVVVTLGVCCVASAFDEGDVVAFCMLDFGVCSVLSADATSALADCVVTILTPVVKSDSAKLVFAICCHFHSCMLQS